MAGILEPRLRQTGPEHSPCGTCLERGAPQLYTFPGRHYAYPGFEPFEEIVEALVVPFPAGSGLLGTIWIVAHGPKRKFDREDVRVMTGLAAFTAAAMRLPDVLDQNAVLDERDRRKSEVLATLAHELRNPLAAVQLSVDLLHEQNPAAGTSAPWQVLRRQLAHLVDLVHGVLDAARLEQKTLTVHKAPTALQGIVQQALDVAAPRIDRAGLTVTTAMPDGVVIVDVDSVRMLQVLANLLDNACKFTDPGGEIAVRAEVAERYVRLTVADTGVGIPPEAISHIFDLFWKGSHHPDQGGLGIGLTLVDALVKLHGGTIEVHSEGPGSGTQFVVTLPLAGIPVADGALRSGRRADPRHRVLLVDDNRDLLAVLAAAIGQTGVQVETSHDGRQVMDLMRTFRPTIVFLDLGMAPLDGYEVARMIRQFERYRTIPLVALTGWGSEDDIERSKRAGFTRHILKPVALDQLEDLLAAVPVPGQ